MRHHAWSLTGIALLIAAWTYLPPPGDVVVPPLGEVMTALRELASRGPLLTDLTTSLWRVLAGVGLATFVAGFLGLLAAIRPEVADLMGGIIELVRPIPPIAWVPVAITVFGIGSLPAVAIVTLGSFFPIWLGLLQGLSQVRTQHVLAVRSLGASRLRVMVDVLLPSMAPYALHGLRLGAGLGWFSLVAAEMLGANSGLGYRVQEFSLNLQMPRTYGYILLIGVTGLVFNSCLQQLERSVARWHRLGTLDYE